MKHPRPLLRFSFAAAALFSVGVVTAETLFPTFDSPGRPVFETDLDRDNTGNLGLGPVRTSDFFRSYFTFDLTNATTATGLTTLSLVGGSFPSGSEGNTSSLAQVFTLFLLSEDWDGAAQPGPVGTTLATVNITPGLGDDLQEVSFSSEALTAAFNNAIGSNLYLGISSDIEGPDTRSFKWFASVEDVGFEPQLIFFPEGGSFSSWITAFFPGEVDPAIVGLGADPDGDGISNGVENLFGTNPRKDSVGLAAGVADSGAGTFTFTHPQGTLVGDLTAAYTWSKDMGDFFPTGSDDGSTVTFETEADTPEVGFTTVTATVTGTPLETLFVRVEVTQN